MVWSVWGITIIKIDPKCDVCTQTVRDILTKLEAGEVVVFEDLGPDEDGFSHIIESPLHRESES